MSKQSVIDEIIHLMKTHDISRGDLNQAYEETQSLIQPVTGTQAAMFNFTNVFIYIGALIIYLGFIIFINENWMSFSNSTKILTSFGIGLIAYMVASITMAYEKTEILSGPAFLIAAMMLPVGLQIIFTTLGFNPSDHYVINVISLLMFLSFFISLLVFKRIILSLFSILFATWFIAHFIVWLHDINVLKIHSFYLTGYTMIFIGLAYILIGWVIHRKPHRILAGPLYGFGSLVLLCAALGLGGWYKWPKASTAAPWHTWTWHFLAPILIVGTIIMSIPMRSKALLTFGTLYLMFFIILLAEKYFSHSIGWPLTLVLMGILLIAVGYYAVSIKNRFFK